MKIITDSAADLSAEEIQAYGIHVMPLYIQFPEGEVSASTITPDNFYDRLRAMQPKLPTTSQPAVGEFIELFKGLDGQPALAVHISSGLSGTVKTAALAAQQSGGITTTVIDTLTLSVGQRFQVLAAALAARAGWSVAQITQRLEAIRASTELLYTLETLDYLARGGRIGRVQALAGSLLQIKPVITVEKTDGKYDTISRGRTIAGNIATMVQHFVTRYGDQPVWVSVAHGQYAEKAEQFAAALKGKLNVAKLETVRISPVLGVHTGPGIVGAGVVPMAHFADLPGL